MLHSFPRSHSLLSHPSASQSHGEYKGAKNLQCTLPKARKSCSPKSGSSQGQGRGVGSEPPPAAGFGGLCSEQAAAFKSTFPYAPFGFEQNKTTTKSHSQQLTNLLWVLPV